MKTTPLIRSLGIRDSLAIVVGSMIGTGVFLKAAVMTQGLGTATAVILAWGTAGVMSLLGAMSYAELGALFPQAGGGYLYIREAFGRVPGFLAGWVSFWILFPGSIAAYGVAAATFLDGALPVDKIGGPTVVAVSLIVLFAALNCLTVAFGGMVQSLFTYIKVALIVLLTIAIFGWAPHHAPAEPVAGAHLAIGAFGSATLAALWAYDGWEAISRIAGEVRNPQKLLPLALVLGVLAVFSLYAVMNLAYFWALPVNEIASSNSTLFPNGLPAATKAAMTVMGSRGVQVLSAVFVISTLGAMNGCVMTAARVPFAMARDGLFFHALNKVSPRTRVPVRAIWIQSLVACVLAVTGSFDQLTNYVIFSAWIFYGLTGYTVFVFRRRLPDQPRAFRVPFYPWAPALFVLMSAGLVINALIENPVESLVGVGLIFTGVPAYYLFFRESAKAQTA